MRRMQEATFGDEEDRKKPASKEAVDRLPIVKIEEKHCRKDETKGTFECPMCPICTDNIEMGQDAMFMPCGHTFHPECLIPWL